MKKIILTVVTIIFWGVTSYAQTSNAIGVRLGGNDGDQSGEISFQLEKAGPYRMEFDLGFGSQKDVYSRVHLAVMYHWLTNTSKKFRWYIGPGALVNYFNYDSDLLDNEIGLNIGGQIGLEYNFKAPFTISIDTRPMWGFLGNDDYAKGFNWDIALGLRFRF